MKTGMLFSNKSFMVAILFEEKKRGSNDGPWKDGGPEGKRVLKTFPNMAEFL